MRHALKFAFFLPETLIDSGVHVVRPHAAESSGRLAGLWFDLELLNRIEITQHLCCQLLLVFHFVEMTQVPAHHPTAHICRTTSPQTKHFRIHGRQPQCLSTAYPPVR